MKNFKIFERSFVSSQTVSMQNTSNVFNFSFKKKFSNFKSSLMAFSYTGERCCTIRMEAMSQETLNTLYFLGIWEFKKVFNQWNFPYIYYHPLLWEKHLGGHINSWKRKTKSRHSMLCASLSFCNSVPLVNAQDGFFKCNSKKHKAVYFLIINAERMRYKYITFLCRMWKVMKSRFL